MRILLMIPLLGVLFLAGCATIDTSIMDTAEPLKAKQFQVSEYQSLGTDPFKIIGSKQLNPDYLFTSLSENPIPSSSLIGGFQGSLGLGYGCELGVKYFFGSGFLEPYQGEGSNGYLKIRIFHPNERISLAISPGYGYEHGSKGDEDPHVFFGTAGETFRYQITNLDLPILYTIKVGKKYPVLHTFCCRLTHDDATIKYHTTNHPEIQLEQHAKDVFISRVGLYYNVTIQITKVFGITGMAGCESIPINSNKIDFFPTIGMSLKLTGKFQDSMFNQP